MTDTREPIAAIKTRPDEAQGEPIEIKPIPFYSHPQLAASVFQLSALDSMTPRVPGVKTDSLAADLAAFGNAGAALVGYIDGVTPVYQFQRTSST